MTKHPDEHNASKRLSRTARLHALLFAGATLGTAVLALGTASGPKLPPSLDE